MITLKALLWKQLKPFFAGRDIAAKHRLATLPAVRRQSCRRQTEGATPMFKTFALAIAIATAAAVATLAHADYPVTGNGLSVNGLSANALNYNAMTQNAVEAHAPLNGRVIAIELPPAAGDLY
jgi:hypothetical protein